MAEEILSKGELTHQAILQAAYELFLEKGYAATSVREIAERTGLALGGIYNHFPNKEAIFSELIIERHPFHQILPLLQNALGETVEEFVRNSARSMVTELGQRPDFIKFLFVELVEFNGRDLPKMIEAIYPRSFRWSNASRTAGANCGRSHPSFCSGPSWVCSCPST